MHVLARGWPAEAWHRLGGSSRAPLGRQQPGIAWAAAAWHRLAGRSLASLGRQEPRVARLGLCAVCCKLRLLLRRASRHRRRHGAAARARCGTSAVACRVVAVGGVWRWQGLRYGVNDVCCGAAAGGTLAAEPCRAAAHGDGDGWPRGDIFPQQDSTSGCGRVTSRVSRRLATSRADCVARLLPQLPGAACDAARTQG